MMTATQTNKNKPILIVVLLAFLASIIYTFYTVQKNNKLISVLETDKQAFKSELDELIVDFDEAIAEKTTLTSALKAERQKVINLRDSVKNIKAENYSLIRKYKNQIKILEADVKRLFKKSDSLNFVNVSLILENEKIDNQLKAKTVENTTLSTKQQELEKNNETLKTNNEQLQTKVNAASVLEIGSIAILPMKERSNGKLTSTSRSSRTDAFRVQYPILENTIAEPSTPKVFLQILDASNKVIAPIGKTTLKDGTEISYSDTTTVDYRKETIDIISLVEVNRELIHKGTYTFKVYVNGILAGTNSVTLK